MFSGKHVSDKLYDYLTGSLAASERASMESHLRGCERCSKERLKVEQALKMLNAEDVEPPELSESYWENYWRTLEPRLKETPEPFSPIKDLLERLRRTRLLTIFSPRLAYGFIGFTLGAIVMLAILSPYLGRPGQSDLTTRQQVESPTVGSATPSSAAEEITQPLIRFFQKAKAFLIAVRNLDGSKEPVKDLSAELETSKKLAAECRSLRQQVLDPREQQLLAELDVVLIQLSKVQNEQDTPKLDLVKEGIEKNNLVMRIRVHELAQEVRFLQASQRESKSNERF